MKQHNQCRSGSSERPCTPSDSDSRRKGTATFKFTKKAILLTFSAIVLSACGASNEAAFQPVNLQPEAEKTSEVESSSAPQVSLVGDPWHLVSLDGADLVPDSSITLTFTDDRVSGSAGCNRYMGSYTTTDAELTFPPIALTRRACISRAIGQQEMNYARILSDVSSHRIDGDLLELSTPQGQTLTYEKETQN